MTQHVPALVGVARPNTGNAVAGLRRQKGTEIVNYSEALKAASEGKPVVLLSLDATKSWSDNKACWTEDGELVMAHPTDARGNPIPAPKDGNYSIA